MKAILMQSYNPAQIVEVKKVTQEMFDKCKFKAEKLSEFKDEEYNVVQYFMLENGQLILNEVSTQSNERFRSKQEFDVMLKVGDVLVKTPQGWGKSFMPIKIIDDKEEKLIDKYNKLGDTNG